MVALGKNSGDCPVASEMDISHLKADKYHWSYMLYIRESLLT